MRSFPQGMKGLSKEQATFDLCNALLTPSTILALFFSPSSPLVVARIRGRYADSYFPSPLQARVFVYIARRFQPFLASSSRVEFIGVTRMFSSVFRGISRPWDCWSSYTFGLSQRK